MSKVFYPKLALNNIQKNGKIYLSYIMTCTIIVAIFYIISSLATNPGIKNVIGGSVISELMLLGSGVIAFFTAIFLFYTNSFLIKRRKKEFGLFNILGMEKRHISRVIFYETIYILIISLGAGFLFGILLDKLIFLILMNLFHTEIALGFYISVKSLLRTVILFLVIFALIYLNSLRQIHLSSPLELLKSGSVGEKEPKSNLFLTLIGLMCLGGGYYLSLITQNPMAALAYFFVAVLLVIAGTYFLFIAGSVTILKLLRKNKHYYYKTKHFISLSSMIYRMKQNAVGLANICILSTMVLIMISSTLSMYTGMENILNRRYPRDLSIRSYDTSEEYIQTLRSQTNEIFKKEGVTPQDELDYIFISFTSLQEKDHFATESANYLQSFNQLFDIFILTLDDYNRLSGSQETLNGNEMLTFQMNKDHPTYEYEALTLYGKTYTIKNIVKPFSGFDIASDNATYTYYFIVKDMDVLRQIEAERMKENNSQTSMIRYSYDINLGNDKEAALRVYDDFTDISGIYVDCRQASEDNSFALYGSLFFLGIFLGVLFILMTILIIYYKQISEGYDDKERFEIMQKVGVSRTEIKASIRSQVLTVFFLPLLAAGVHTIFAFPVTSKLLAALQMTQTSLFILCIVITFLIFAIFYAVIYSLTAKTYYKIVSQMAEN